jgi:formiminoglutamase
MDSFKLYTQSEILDYVNIRQGEEKLGEHVKCINSVDLIQDSAAKFVLLGIPEDIGVRANFGVAGTKTAWDATLKSLLNMQSNPSLAGDEILILGYFDIKEPEDQSIQGLRDKTNTIDALVYPVIQKIVAAGKIPIVIGGGHNNAAPIIAGTSIALNQQLNVVNIDAHADLRPTNEGRHSGNGFSYAIQHGYLNRYFMFGLHQSYLHSTLSDEIENNPKLNAVYFDDLLLDNVSAEEKWISFVKPLEGPCGLEIDLDSVAHVLSSAITPTGFNLNDIRRILLSSNKNYSYLHICEGACALVDGRKDTTTGKTIAYLVSDFIKALLPRISQKL